LPMASRKMHCKQSFWLTSSLLMMWDSQEMVLRTFIIPMSESMTIPTLPWHQHVNIDFPSISGWASYVINS
jgi:hypothetical protein